MPPMSETSFCSGSRSITGKGVSGSNSVEFAPVHAGDVAGELGDRDLHAQADAQVRDPLLARDPRRADLALDAAPAEAARDQDAVGAVEPLAAASLASSASESTQSISTWQPCLKPAWRRASTTER